MQLVPNNSAFVDPWLHRPLCRRYAVVVVSTASQLLSHDAATANERIWWALGALINGDREILGAWTSNEDGAIPGQVFGGLYDRGVECITYASGEMAACQGAFMNVYPRAVLLPSVEQSLAAALASVKAAHRSAMEGLLRATAADLSELANASLAEISSADWRERYPAILKLWDEAVAAFHPLTALPEPYRQLVRSVDRTAMQVQERLMRAIHRHGLFIDASEAFDFVVAALQRADRQLYLEREAATLLRDENAPWPPRVTAASVRALGTPTLA